MRSTRDLTAAEALISQGDGPRSVSRSSPSGWWLVPVDDRRAASAALSLYRPVRLSRTVAWHGTRLLARAGGLGVIARTRWTVRASFAAALGDVLGETNLRLSVWLPPERDRAVICGASPSGRVAGFAKIAFSASARARLAREGRALTQAADLSRLLAAPRLLHAGEIDGVDAIVLTSADGRMGLAPWRLDRRRVRALASLVREDRHRAFAELLPPETPDREPWASLVGRAEEALAPWRDRELPVAFAHGDFTPWNVLNRGNGVVAVDWEDAEIEGIPYWDAWHFATQAATFGGAGSADRLVRSALGGDGTLGRALDAYAATSKVSSSFARPVLLAYLARSFGTVTKHGDPERADRARALSFRRRVLERLLSEWR